MTWRAKAFWALLIGVAVLSAAPLVYADTASSSSFTVRDSIVTVSGGLSTSASFQYISATGQTVSGESTATGFIARDGALYYPIATSPVVSATAGENLVSLNWTASVATLANITEYQVGQSTSSSGTYTYTSVGTDLSDIVTGLDAGTTYYFKIRALAGTLILSTSAAASAVPTGVSPEEEEGGSSGGGGGGGSSVSSGSGTIMAVFEGRAYPSVLVTLLQDARIIATTESDANAYFSLAVPNLTRGSYTFSLYSEDFQGRRSSLHTFSVALVGGAGSVTDINGIFIAPTIALDRDQLLQGDPVAIFGQSSPNDTVTITVHSESEHSAQTTSDDSGVYLYSFNTSVLELGSHTARARSSSGFEMSGMSLVSTFMVTDAAGNTTGAPGSALRGDVNADGKVNLIDFSIAAYWYGRQISGPIVQTEIDRLNGDGRIDLIDMSILAYYWSG